MILPIDPRNFSAGEIQIGADLLVRGECLIHPTETVYGFAAKYDMPAAIDKVIEAKGRLLNQPFSIMVSSVDEMIAISGVSSPRLREKLRLLFPAPITVIIPRMRELSVPYWNQFPELGFRMPDHPFSQALIRAAKGPLITTSANRTGSPVPRSSNKIIEIFRGSVPLIYDAGDCGGGKPSTIVRIDMDGENIWLLREGAVDFGNIEKHFVKR